MPPYNASGTFQALYRVFVLPELRKTASHQSRIPRANLARATAKQRTFGTAAPRWSKTRAPEQRTQKWDEEITARIITLVNAEDNKLSEPRTRFDVLNTLDRQTHRLVQVSQDEPGNRSFVPICKIISKKEQFEADKKRKKAQKENAKAASVQSSTKTLELNWAIDHNDLGHRLDRVTEFLSEGRKVEIIMAAKKGGRRASTAECQEVLKKIRDCVDGVDGARETKDMQGKLGGFTTMFFAGRAQTKEIPTSETKLDGTVH